MRTHRRIAKWTGFTATSLLIAAWGLSTVSYFGNRWANGSELFCSGGGIQLGHIFGPPAERSALATMRLNYRQGWDADWRDWTLPPPTSIRGVLGLGLGYSRSHVYPAWPNASYWRCYIPIWIPFLIASIPTAILWHRDRRRPTEGHCPNCNYNMTGNVSNKCPECGTPTPKPEPAAAAQALNVRTRSASAGQARVPKQDNVATSPENFL